MHRFSRDGGPLTANTATRCAGDTDDAKEHIRAVLKVSPFHGEDHRQVWVRLCFQSLRTLKVRALRWMCQNGLLAPVRAGRFHGPPRPRPFHLNGVVLINGGERT